ncbi:hypothetical protein SAMN04487893_10167 [Myroides guanonis]|uniref:Uncharacterized protein n=1 Tax=Myroides guanonis TaxID=1150112 RepID=A0A1I3KUF2_9FLAO|nr:hypothetical protein SAMN04487893_10167 [Myroides guanonis]
MKYRVSEPNIWLLYRFFVDNDGYSMMVNCEKEHVNLYFK